MTGVHESFRDHGGQKTASDRSFGIVFAVVFGVIAAAQWYFDRPEWAVGLGCASAAFLAAALIVPKILAPMNWVWTRFGLLLHKVTNPIILGAIFFLVCTPMGVVMRLFGFDPLRTKLDPSADSYWIDRDPPGPAPDTMPNQF
ncbi:SxtJ family membrane protein [Pacificispira sp.]|uniref:SxtJ family membrane protein n=1 Tax=Pacificispira sp. TaxID=2888761 RepID=UPI003B51DD38